MAGFRETLLHTNIPTSAAENSVALLLAPGKRQTANSSTGLGTRVPDSGFGSWRVFISHKPRTPTIAPIFLIFLLVDLTSTLIPPTFGLSFGLSDRTHFLNLHLRYPFPFRIAVFWNHDVIS
jgi:hypothetical protein